MNSPMLHLTLRELQNRFLNTRLWTVFAVVVLLFAVTGPFGTLVSLSLPERLGYWLIIHACTWITALSVLTLIETLLKNTVTADLPRYVIGAALSAVPVGIVLTIVNHALIATPLSFPETGTDILTALPLCIAFSILSWMATDNRADSLSEAPPDPRAKGKEDIRETASNRPALLDRLPPEKRGTIIRLEVQDHYVLAVTERGRAMILLRLADAIRETEPTAGLQVHRSHWVARHGITDIIREPGKNGRTLIRTRDGAEIPVSRARLADVKTLV